MGDLIYACEDEAEFCRVISNAMMLWYLGACSVNVIHAKERR